MELESFVDTQKYSVMKDMRHAFQKYLTYEVMKDMRHAFQKYLTYEKNHNELLYFALRGLTLDALAFKKATSKHRITSVEIPETDLLERAKQFKVYNLTQFYKSNIFRSNDFTYDPKRKVIIQTLPVVDED